MDDVELAGALVDVGQHAQMEMRSDMLHLVKGQPHPQG
jgi:hypothetical protein